MYFVYLFPLFLSVHLSSVTIAYRQFIGSYHIDVLMGSKSKLLNIDMVKPLSWINKKNFINSTFKYHLKENCTLKVLQFLKGKDNEAIYYESNM